MQSDEAEPTQVLVTIDGLEATTTPTRNDRRIILSGGENIEVVPVPAGLHVIDRFQPDDETAAILEGSIGPREVADVGIRVNNECWGWAWNEPGSCWYLSPCDFDANATSLFDFSATFERSMTSEVVVVGCRTAGGVTVASQWDDVGGVQWLEVQYGGDWRQLATKAASIAFDWELSHCPICIDEAGWVLSVDFDETVGDRVVLQAADDQWTPCVDHSARAAEVLDLIGCRLRWAADHWVMK